MILPFGVQASRSFQPDPGMVMWMVLGVYVPVPLVGAAQLEVGAPGRDPRWDGAADQGDSRLLRRREPRSTVVLGTPEGSGASGADPQVWVMAVLIVLPVGARTTPSRQGRAAEYLDGWTHLALAPADRALFLRALAEPGAETDGVACLLLASLVGVLLAARATGLCCWACGSATLYGLFLPYQMYTHSYYHLQLVPIIGLSLAPVAQLLIDRIAQQANIWRRCFRRVVLVVLLPGWDLDRRHEPKDYRGEPAYWQDIASLLPTDGKIIALTQDYGYPLVYYGWRKVRLWPIGGEQKLSDLRGISKEFEDLFAKRTAGKSYFLITAFGQFNDQPDLKQYLEERIRSLPRATAT